MAAAISHVLNPAPGQLEIITIFTLDSHRLPESNICSRLDRTVVVKVQLISDDHANVVVKHFPPPPGRPTPRTFPPVGPIAT